MKCILADHIYNRETLSQISHFLACIVLPMSVSVGCYHIFTSLWPLGVFVVWALFSHQDWTLIGQKTCIGDIWNKKHLIRLVVCILAVKCCGYRPIGPLWQINENIPVINDGMLIALRNAFVTLGCRISSTCCLLSKRIRKGKCQCSHMQLIWKRLNNK